MPITRTFLDWSRPALPAAVDALLAPHAGEEIADLSGTIVVVPGGRAGRRLLELLIERTDSRLIPPEIITEGRFPELLYQPQRPFAGQLVQQLAWGEAVRRLPRPLAERVLREIPDDGDVEGWLALGELLWTLHRELAAQQLDFGDVLTEGERLPQFAEQRRWEALQTAQQEYLAILDSHQLWDKQTARLVAIKNGECRTDIRGRTRRNVVLIGTVDLNRMTRAMLDQLVEHAGDRVTAMIHAPQSLAHRFDEHGCLKPDDWSEVEIDDLMDDQLRVAEGPGEQADEVVWALSSFDARYRADDVTIGLADDGLVPFVQRRLQQYDVPSRWVVGKTLPQTNTVRLLSAVADYLDDPDAERFAALVRHPAVGDWLSAKGVEPGWLTELDKYRSKHLPTRLDVWLGRSKESRQIQRAHERIKRLLEELIGPRRPLSKWTNAIVQLPLKVMQNREFDPERLNDRAELDAFSKLQDALDEFAEVPESLSLVVGGAQAIRLTLELLETETVPPPRAAAAIELLGWLELPLDDAPALIVTSFNSPYVPQAVDADLFLPNQLRQQLGITDNDRRYARDCYALSAMLASRESVTLIAARRDRRGDPLLPSRLTLACDAETIARRVEAFYESQSVPLPPLDAIGDRSEPTVHEPPGLAPPLPQRLEPPKDTFRVTAFRDYIACPYRFYLKHILGLSGIDDTMDEMSPGLFGEILHRVLEGFGSSDRKDSTDPTAITERLHDLLEHHASLEFGRKRSTAVIVQLQQMQHRLETFAKWQAEHAAQGWSIAFVEESGKDRTAELRVDEQRTLFLKGRIDRIDRHADGRWAIFDYKTGEAGDSPGDAHRKKRSGEWIDLQLPLYRLLAESLGVTGDVALGYITLPRDSNKAEAKMADWSAEDLQSADDRALAIARSILDQEFLPISDLGTGAFDDYAAICQEGVFDRRPPA